VVRQKFQPLFKHLFEFVMVDPVTIGGIGFMWRFGAVFHSPLWLLIVATLSSFPALAVNDAMRTRFVQAEKSIVKASPSQAKKILTDLQTYPLVPYLELEVLSKDLDDTSSVVRFMREHQGTPLERTLRKRWLIALKNKRQAELFLKNYDYGSDTVLDCYALEMRLILEKPVNVWPAVQDLWAVGKSQPEECDVLFERWRKAGQRNTAAVWQRMLAAVDSDNQRMLPYLRSLLPKDQQYLADKWIQLMNNPALIQRKSFLTGRQGKELDLAAYGMQKLVWKKPDATLEVWERYHKSASFSAENRSVTARQIAIALASKNDGRAKNFFGLVADEHKDRLFAQWLLTYFLRQHDWYGLIEAIKALPASYADEDSSLYWLARAYDEVKLGDSARHLYQQLAERRSYYGYMAAARIGAAPSLAHKPVPVSETDYLAFQSSATARRIREWLALDRPNAAKRELTSLQKYGSELQKFSAAKYAFDLGWHDNTIVALAQAGYYDDIELRFPTLYKKEILSYSNKVNVDPAWAMAIARRESTFMPLAKSAAGAVGLMQVTPLTARHITGKRISEKQLYNAETNISYGTYYLNYLLKNNKNNLVYATAAYNAGPSRIKAWAPKDGPVPLDIWIETIPFKETRDYVKNVLLYYQIYSLKLDTKRQVFAPLATMQVG